MSIWTDKLKKAIADLDKTQVIPTAEVVAALREFEPLFNIHKRTLPVEFDVPMMFGLTSTEADQAIARLTERERKYPTVRKDFIVYYDKVSEGASERERSVYYNSIRPMIDIILGTGQLK